MTIRQSDPGLVDPDAPPEETLARAVTAALRAPSVFNTQPWQWRLHDGVAALRADRDRQLRTVDPDGRLLVLSCGVALHHARVAVAAAGRRPLVTRFPEPGEPNLLAVLRADGPYEPRPADERACAAIWDRRTDRRPYADAGIDSGLLDLLRDAAEAEGAHLHVLRDDDVPVLTVAATHAAEIETGDPAYREELNVWTHRPGTTADGVPADTAVRPVRDRVHRRRRPTVLARRRGGDLRGAARRDRPRPRHQPGQRPGRNGGRPAVPERDPAPHRPSAAGHPPGPRRDRRAGTGHAAAAGTVTTSPRFLGAAGTVTGSRRRVPLPGRTNPRPRAALLCRAARAARRLRARGGPDACTGGRQATDDRT